MQLNESCNPHIIRLHRMLAYYNLDMMAFDASMFVLSQFSNNICDSISGFGYDGNMVDIFCENYMFSVSGTEIFIYTWQGIKNFPLCCEGIDCLIDHMIIGDRST